eukprot:TRINITY_DN1217_c4_g1_i1.p1 TRINITY_DN1217_c4_g1~~TRINITY_DN1217_c4_g1_i1.p1  ORF type:complete len:277 (-),score=140.56 TRINITY_DN1217_c4_g1_i1:149-979(-)
MATTGDVYSDLKQFASSLDEIPTLPWLLFAHCLLAVNGYVNLSRKPSSNHIANKLYRIFMSLMSVCGGGCIGGLLLAKASPVVTVPLILPFTILSWILLHNRIVFWLINSLPIRILLSIAEAIFVSRGITSFALESNDFAVSVLLGTVAGCGGAYFIIGDAYLRGVKDFNAIVAATIGATRTCFVKATVFWVLIHVYSVTVPVARLVVFTLLLLNFLTDCFFGFSLNWFYVVEPAVLYCVRSFAAIEHDEKHNQQNQQQQQQPQQNQQQAPKPKKA